MIKFSNHISWLSMPDAEASGDAHQFLMVSCAFALWFLFLSFIAFMLCILLANNDFRAVCHQIARKTFSASVPVRAGFLAHLRAYLDSAIFTLMTHLRASLETTISNFSPHITYFKAAFNENVMGPTIRPALQDISTGIKSAQDCIAKLAVLTNNRIQDLMKDEQRINNLISGFLNLYFTATGVWAFCSWLSLPSLCLNGSFCFAFKVHFFYLPSIACLIYNALLIRNYIELHVPVIADYVFDSIHDATGYYWRNIEIQESLGISLPSSDNFTSQDDDLPDMEELFVSHMNRNTVPRPDNMVNLLADFIKLRDDLSVKLPELVHASFEATALQNGYFALHHNTMKEVIDDLSEGIRCKAIHDYVNLALEDIEEYMEDFP
ncbi:hypothetical protein AUEXF2481DRAFT_257611 [Aureobasidium subglaciale EXF-2481]|uniref:Uncharacterized protein n=1 Tax=Aureobasidium subglaciale (strain EXF-2481) TaxID=1043005 RepID=A0A074YKZ2_AURSE|nr:uncharacterized protein AUEXF2481DRAFT_257611 [Aureobasidium subglaciale EXF-2481]KAI5212559.1 hypothetical protein E4T38_00498 [Aureobasidium subglaciale]KAI5234515.1 hypothetical protein E4T41_00497 [Aureobasidium subglaciale]KAI5267958.1 hypothetical protein E4T46_00497 [Aureobasidium subglaciale]KEQ94767.1 hypothetical protein AUEXF2481DRAFT_257611 [Aureobasidium subglaciale EXF-2481]